MNKWIGLAALALGVSVGASESSAAPLLQYSFDEASSGNVDSVDSVAPAANGTFQNGATRTGNTPSGSGAALDLISAEAGSPNAHVRTVGDVAKLDGLSQFTLSTWLYLDEGGSGSDRLLAKQAATSFAGFNWSIHDPNSGTRAAGDVKMGLFVGGSTAFTFAYSTADVNALDKWVFLAVSYDGTQTSDNTRYYVGGLNTPVAQLGSAVTINAGTTTDSDARFGVGFTDAAAGSDTSPNGFLDDVRVDSELLDATALEAVRLSNVPEPGAMAVLGLGLVGLAARRRR